MTPNKSIEFFERQFANQVKNGEMTLNPFEREAIPHLTGRVLDYGCGMGNLALAAAEQGCEVMAFDASASAIAHINKVVSGGVVVVNVLVEGTTYLDMFDGQGHCLFPKNELESRFAGWEIVHSAFAGFDAPKDTQKCFATVIARRPSCDVPRN